MIGDIKFWFVDNTKVALDMDPIVLDRSLKRSWLNCHYVNARGKWIYCSQTRRHSGHSCWHLSSTNNYLHWTRRRNCRWILIGDRAINNFSNVQITNDGVSDAILRVCKWRRSENDYVWPIGRRFSSEKKKKIMINVDKNGLLN